MLSSSVVSHVRQAEFDVEIEGPSGSAASIHVHLHALDLGRSLFLWIGVGQHAELGALVAGVPIGGASTVLLDGAGDADAAADFARILAARTGKLVLQSWAVDDGILDANASAEVRRRALAFISQA